MPDLTTVYICHGDDPSLEVSNGRASLGSEANATDGTWLPTELFLAGLGACKLATLVYHAQVNKIDVSGVAVRATGEAASRPARFGRIEMTYELPDRLTPAEVEALVRAGDRCKVQNTLYHDPEVVVHVERISRSVA